MSKHSGLAHDNFHQGYNCAQSVVAAFSDVLGCSRQQALKMSAGFGGGMGRMREVCGAFSGLVMVLGCLYGSDDPADKTALYTTVQALAGEFKARNGGNSILCRELLGLSHAEGSPVASPRTEEYYKKRPCDEMIRLCAELMDEYITEHPLPQKEEQDHDLD